MNRDNRNRRADPDVGLRRHGIGPMVSGDGRVYDIFARGQGPHALAQAAEISAGI